MIVDRASGAVQRAADSAVTDGPGGRSGRPMRGAGEHEHDAGGVPPTASPEELAMAKTLEWMVPLGVALVVYALATRFLLDKGWSLGTWLVAAFLVGHGLIHLGFATPAPAAAPTDGIDYPFDLGRSWLVGAGLEAPLVKAIGVALVAIVTIGFAVAALAAVGWLVPGGWWTPAVVVASVASALLLLVGLSPTLVLGFAIDAVLLWLVLAQAWTPTPTPSLA